MSPSDCPRNPGYLERLRSQIPLKLLIALVLNISTWVPYQLLQHHPIFTPMAVPATVLDQAIPFWPGTTWIYLSAHGLTLLAPLFLFRKRDLLEYGAGMLAINFTADLVFLFCPTLCPRPAWESGHPAYDFLLSIDNELHAFPSLHAGFCLYSAFWAVQTLRERKAPPGLFFLLWFWTFSIYVATLTTKQHVVVDLLAGSLLAWIAHAAFRKMFAGESKSE